MCKPPPDPFDTLDPPDELAVAGSTVTTTVALAWPVASDRTCTTLLPALTVAGNLRADLAARCLQQWQRHFVEGHAGAAQYGRRGQRTRGRGRGEIRTAHRNETADRQARRSIARIHNALRRRDLRHRRAPGRQRNHAESRSRDDVGNVVRIDRHGARRDVKPRRAQNGKPWIFGRHREKRRRSVGDVDKFQNRTRIAGRRHRKTGAIGSRETHETARAERRCRHHVSL